jgi:hypothetical protein
VNNKLANSEQTNLAESSRLFERVREILNVARTNVARSVNTEMVRTYWQIGQAIVEDEQQDKNALVTANRLFNRCWNA